MNQAHWEWRITRLFCAAGCAFFSIGAIVLALLTPDPRLHDTTYVGMIGGAILMVIALSIPYWYVTLAVLVLACVAAIVVFAMPFKVTRGEVIVWVTIALLSLPVAGVVRIAVRAHQDATPGPTECSRNPKFGQGPSEKEWICRPWIIPSFAPATPSPRR